MKLFARQLGFELLKLFTRKRTYMGFAAFLAVEIVILLHAPRMAVMFQRIATHFNVDFAHYFSGLTLAHVMITYTVFLLGSLYLALVCGDIIAKEVEDGTMRMILSRPVSRLRVLLLKILACVAYTWALTLFIVLSSLVLGIADRGVGGLMVAAPQDHVFAFFEAREGLQHFAIGTGILGLVMMTISSIGFMFSCFNVKPASATVMTLSLYVIDGVLRTIPSFENIRPYLLTQRMAVWTQSFQQAIPWRTIVHSLLYLGAWDVAFVGLGALYFFRRDFKS